MIAEQSELYIGYLKADGRHSYANKVYAKFMGLSPEQMVGKTIAEIVAGPEVYEALAPHEKKALGGTTARFEITVPKQDGGVSTFSSEFLPHTCEKTNKVLGVAMIARDVSERQISNHRFKSLTDSIPQLMWTADARGYVNYINARCREYSGLDSTEKFGEAWVSSLHEEDRDRILANWVKSVSSASEFKDEYRLRGKNGDYRWFKGHAMPIHDSDGKLDYWIGTATDIEEEKQRALELKIAKQEAEKASRAKSSFLANMSHEIRTPLSAILGFSDLLKSNDLSGEQRAQFAQVVDRQGQMLTRIIDDLLDLARIESGRIGIETAKFSVRNLSEEILGLFGPAAELKGISLNVSVSHEVPQVVESDPVRLRQILINIVGNAVKFTSSGGISLRFKSKAASQGRVELAIEVEDTGIGMSDEQAQFLFNPFTQADESNSRRHGGAGLGLPISKRLAEAMGGTVTVARCSPNGGCTFLITLLAVPVSDGPGSSSPGAPPSKGNGTINFTGLRILVVDDSQDNLTLIEHILASKGATIDVADCGKQALLKAGSHKYNFILLDIQMPEMDGYQTLAELRRQGVQCPVAALTAHAMGDEVQRTKAAGFFRHLTKPLNLSALYEAIRAATAN